MGWKIGTSGNYRGGPGRPPLTPEAREAQRLAMDLAPRAVRRLAELMTSEDPHVALRACVVILDRALGKPPQAVTLTTEEDREEADDIAARPVRERIVLLEEALAVERVALAREEPERN